MAEMTIAPVATHGFFVDGRWHEDGDIVEIRAPYDGSVIARVVQGRRQHAEAAIAAAVKAFGTTRRLPAFERQRVLRRISASMTERKEEFARTLAQEAGKPIKAARTEVERAIFTFNVAAEERKHSHLRRISSTRLAGIHRRTLGDRTPVSARPHRRHHAV
jgi:acyl-CoA reductase-like NAD-dependent aldehyde dehydrogenase